MKANLIEVLWPHFPRQTNVRYTQLKIMSPPSHHFYFISPLGGSRITVLIGWLLHLIESLVLSLCSFLYSRDFCKIDNLHRTVQDTPAPGLFIGWPQCFCCRSSSLRSLPWGIGGFPQAFRPLYSKYWKYPRTLNPLLLTSFSYQIYFNKKQEIKRQKCQGF